MKVAGIIMECNPFHEGHAYLLREARKRTEADYVIVAMSGDFVQRGEPAIFDKYIRAEQILRAGADLVLELPLYAACGSAEYFARGGIALLDKLGVVTDLCFGSESGNLEHLLHCAQVLTLAEDDTSSAGAAKYREKLHAALRSGRPFPAARAEALEESFVYNDRADDTALHYPSRPNDLLAAEYCRALRLSGSAILPHAVRRINVPSATQHRQLLLRNRGGLFLSAAFSPQTGSRRESAPGNIFPQTSVTQVPLFPVSPDDFSPQLMYALLMHETQLESYADVSPDLASRIRKNTGRYSGFTGFCDLLKTRNLTRTRVSRCLLHILLQIRQKRLDALQSAEMALYARPLALDRTAVSLFSAIRQSASVPFLSKLSGAGSHLTPEAFSFLEEEIRAEDLYCLTLAGIAGASAEAGSFPAVPGALQRKMPVIGL